MWCISDEYKLIITTETGGEVTYEIYQIDWCQNEVIQKIRDDWLSFNSGRIILRMTNFNHDHPVAHKKMGPNLKKKKSPEKWKEDELGKLCFQYFIFQHVVDLLHNLVALFRRHRAKLEKKVRMIISNS